MTVSSRVGMLIIYTPALIWSTWLLATIDFDGDGLRCVVCMLVAHFLKRDAEVLFLHEYSGGMELAVAAPIGIFYALMARLVTYSAGLARVDMGGLAMVGLLLFLLGELGNFYHHWVLASLRKKGDAPASSNPLLRSFIPKKIATVTKGNSQDVYVVPGGGLFDFVTMPHYFCELIAWFGLFLVAPRLNILLVCTGMTSYLSGRSASTTAWYKSRFGDRWPADRKNLVPFVF